MTLSEVDSLVARAKAAGQVVVLTNGHFDLLHVGHVRYLQAARALGDVLVVGVNSDASTRALKGPTRPLLPAEERAELLQALRCVDATLVFEGNTASALIERLRPAIYAKGGDYASKELVEAEVARQCGAEVRLLPEVPGRSTSSLIEVIRKRFCP